MQVRSAINSVFNYAVIPEIQNIMGSMSFGQRSTESGSSNNIQENKREEINGLKAKLTKKDSWSAFELRDTET